MAYADLNSIHNPATGTAPPAAWGDQARDNDQYLYERGPYICTSSTKPASPFTGQVIFETDTGYLRLYNGTDWQPVSPHKKHGTITPSTTRSTSSTTYVNWPVTDVMQVAFTKQSGQTNLLCVAGGSHYSNTTTGVLTLAVYNGATATEIAKHAYNVANSHTPWAGACLITGLSAGAKTLTLQAKVTASNAIADASDRQFLIVEEIAA